MNPLRRAIHLLMESTGLDRRINENAVNGWLERRHAKRFPIFSAANGNDWIAQVIAAGQPAAIGKIGDRECCALAAHLGLRQFYKYTWTSPSFGESDLCQQAGVFPPTLEIYQAFADIFLERVSELDGCAIWHNPGESRIVATFAPRAKRFELKALDPFLFQNPWSARLAGKRVLVIHPFEESIRSQFARRAALWPTNPSVLPDFDLETVRAPYGFSKTDFGDWREMLRWLEAQVISSFRRKRFDVALIGCGAASIPLAGFVKRLGAIGIHTGGPTQLLFGIHGRRWSELPDYQRLFTHAWVRPAEEERPPEFKAVDKGGYW